MKYTKQLNMDTFYVYTLHGFKLLLHWTRSGPGFYAGIYVTSKCEWSDTVYTLLLLLL